jgi:alkylation response protein AidB-like acyl-CoA dehydrogenase
MDFDIDPAFQEELDWADSFVREEVEPLDLVLNHAWDMSDPLRMELIPPLQDRVRERGLWATHLGPELGGPGYGQVKLALLNEILGRSHSGPIVFGCQAPDSGNAEILAHYGTPEQKKQFLEPLLRNDIVSCFSMTEPQGGADPKVFTTRAELDGDEWVIEGQKVWTSLAHWAQWCFVLCRTDRDAPKHKGLSYVLVPMRQDGIEIRPIQQITGTSEFNEVFFDGARTPLDNVVGGVNDGWRVAMGTLAFERGASTLGQQAEFENELETIIELARKTGRATDPVLRQRLADAWIGLRLLRYNALRALTPLEHGEITPLTSIAKLAWASFHRSLGELALEVLGPDAEIGEGSGAELTALQRMFLYSRADTIYGGSNQVQRNVIGERALGLPKEPR